MKGTLPILLALCVGLAAAQAVAKVIGLLIILSVVAVIITRPREMIALAVTVGSLNLFALYPITMIGLAAAGLAFTLRWRKPGAGSNERPQLPRRNDR